MGTSSAARLSEDEDAALRRLHFFERVGAVLSADMQGFKDELRARDLRDVVREPVVPIALIPVARRSVD
jgi:hypothetical protein